MQGQMTKKKCLFVGVIAISVGFVFIIQSAITGVRHGTKDGRHFKFKAKPNAQRKYDIVDKYLDEESNQNNDQSFDEIGFDLDNQVVHASIQKSPEAFRNSSLVHKLADALGYKLSTVTAQERKLRPVCHNSDVIANSCDDSNCLRTSFSTSLVERVAELVDPTHLTISSKIQRALDNMVEDVPQNVDFTIVTAASSNHFLEAQGLIKSMHQNVYPHFKNFTFVFFNIGLTSEERAQLARHCKCHVVDFPFDKFPSLVQKIKCYSWKPIILNALVTKAKTILWVDSSIRFNSDPSYLSELLQKVEKQTMQLGNTQIISPFRTYRSMYHFFGDEPCVYLNMFQAIAGVFGFKGEFFVKRAVLDPWVACALSESCMCPSSTSKLPKKSCVESRKMEEAWEVRKGPIVYGLCHRFDQSSISLILHKLYQGYYHWVNFHIGSYLSIQRNDNQEYFNSLVNAEQ